MLPPRKGNCQQLGRKLIKPGSFRAQVGAEERREEKWGNHPYPKGMVGKQEILVCGQTVPDAGYTADQAQMTPEVEGLLWS